MYHQHFFCARLDLDVDGERNTVYEVHTESLPDGPENPYGNAFVAGRDAARRREQRGAAADRPARRAVLEGREPGRRERASAEPVAYKLIPGANVLPFARPDSSICARAAFMTQHLWVTPFDPDERYPGRRLPEPAPRRRRACPEWTAADRAAREHGRRALVRVRNPPRPASRGLARHARRAVGFMLKPLGFFDRNPALDVPPPPSHCHT